MTAKEQQGTGGQAGENGARSQEEREVDEVTHQHTVGPQGVDISKASRI